MISRPDVIVERNKIRGCRCQANTFCRVPLPKSGRAGGVTCGSAARITCLRSQWRSGCTMQGAAAKIWRVRVLQVSWAAMHGRSSPLNGSLNIVGESEGSFQRPRIILLQGRLTELSGGFCQDFSLTNKLAHHWQFVKDSRFDRIILYERPTTHISSEDPSTVSRYQSETLCDC